MFRPKTCPIEASNIANLGSDLEKKVKRAAATGENAWQTVGAPGFHVWRIEKFNVKAWPKQHYGKLFKGDSYIVLHSYTKAGGRELLHDAHFWLGEQSSQDEIGTAAYKTVELDDYLGGVPVQHREVQGHESKLFLSYFPGESIQLLDGGIESGFHHVEPASYQPRLLHVAGRGRQIVVSQVPLERNSLNSEDVFILDRGLKIHQWNGAHANVFEKLRAGEVVRETVSERDGKPQVVLHDEGDADCAEFWDILGGHGPVAASAPRPAHLHEVDHQGGISKLFRLSDSSGTLTYNLEHHGTLHKSQLDTNDAFIVDSGSQVFVWIGKKASDAERKGGLQYAQKYVAEHNRPAYIPISRVLEGGESDVFEMCFEDGAAGHAEVDSKTGSIKHPCCPHK